MAAENNTDLLRFKNYHHQHSVIPHAVLDANLHIIWHNQAFSTLFHQDEGCTGVHIAGLVTLSGANGRSLFHQLKDPETGFSFIGNGESRFQHFPTIYTNVQILPVLTETGGQPAVSGYFAYFHDYSDDHRRSMQAIFSSLLQASRMKDNDTGQHIERVNQYSSLMAEHLYLDGTDLQVNRDFVENISFLAAMHDVGKIGIPDDILNKAGSLDDWEWEIMKTHTLNGAYILGAYPDIMAVEIARSHHERWDGNGYPYGLIEEMIPLSARIVTIADVYDAIRTKRSYKNEMSHEQAAELVMLGGNTQFDPELVAVFKALEGDFDAIYEEMRDPSPSTPHRHGG